MIKFLIMCVASLFICVSGQSSTVICEKFQSPLTGGYCIDRPNPVKNRDIVYYFHGLTTNEHQWQNPLYYTEQIRKEWAKHHASPPTVVAISFGPTWVLASKNASPYSGLFEVFTQSVLPNIEKSLGGLKGRRILFGESMGGDNSAQMVLRTRLFSKAAILCAQFAKFSPYSSPSDIESILSKTGAWNYYKGENPNPVQTAIDQEIQLAKAFFPTSQDWDQIDPMKLVSTVNIRHLPNLYIAVGYIDQYASYEATEEFVGILKKRGAHVQWRPQWGAHCAVDIPSLASFLIN